MNRNSNKNNRQILLHVTIFFLDIISNFDEKGRAVHRIMKLVVSPC